jgi:hypothetical protein
MTNTNTATAPASPSLLSMMGGVTYARRNELIERANAALAAFALHGGAPNRAAAITAARTAAAVAGGFPFAFNEGRTAVYHTSYEGVDLTPEAGGFSCFRVTARPLFSEEDVGEVFVENFDELLPAVQLAIASIPFNE